MAAAEKLSIKERTKLFDTIEEVANNFSTLVEELQAAGGSLSEEEESDYVERLDTLWRQLSEVNSLLNGLAGDSLDEAIAELQKVRDKLK